MVPGVQIQAIDLPFTGLLFLSRHLGRGIFRFGICIYLLCSLRKQDTRADARTILLYCHKISCFSLKPRVWSRDRGRLSIYLGCRVKPGSSFQSTVPVPGCTVSPERIPVSHQSDIICDCLLCHCSNCIFRHRCRGHEVRTASKGRHDITHLRTDSLLIEFIMEKKRVTDKGNKGSVVKYGK